MLKVQGQESGFGILAIRSLCERLPVKRNKAHGHQPEMLAIAALSASASQQIERRPMPHWNQRPGRPRVHEKRKVVVAFRCGVAQLLVVQLLASVT